MGTLNINDIKEGMELAEDIVNFNGIVLLKAGSEITKKNLMALQAWGITEANISGVEQDSFDKALQETANPEVMEKIEKELSYLFQNTDLEDPIMAEIYRLMKKRRLGELTHE